MSDNWVVQNLENALAIWNEKLAEIWQLITQSPETFKGGTIWNVVLLIHDTMQAICRIRVYYPFAPHAGVVYYLPLCVLLGPLTRQGKTHL